MKFFSRSEWRDGCNICTCDSGRVDCSPMPCQCSEPGVDPGCCPECQAGATCPHQVELRMLSHFFTTEFFSLANQREVSGVQQPVMFVPVQEIAGLTYAPGQRWTHNCMECECLVSPFNHQNPDQCLVHPLI